MSKRTSENVSCVWAFGAQWWTRDYTEETARTSSFVSCSLHSLRRRDTGLSCFSTLPRPNHTWLSLKERTKLVSRHLSFRLKRAYVPKFSPCSHWELWRTVSSIQFHVNHANMFNKLISAQGYHSSARMGTTSVEDFPFVGPIYMQHLIALLNVINRIYLICCY